MTLADQIARDLPTFVNPTEFGGVRVVDGRSVACDLQENERKTADGSGDGIYLLEFVLRIRTVDLVAVPVITQRMAIDGRQARVVNVVEEQGLQVIRLQWSES